MTVVKPDLKKLENLLKSATNARQRKMYQSLLDKARQDLLRTESTACSALTAESKVDAVRVDSSKANQKQKKQKKQKKQTIVQVLEEKSVSQLETTNKAKKKKSSKKSVAKPSTIFQAVGSIKCTPHIKEDKLYITIDGQEYELKRGDWKSRKYYDDLKLEIEEKGEHELWMRVYPKIAHNSKKQEIRSWFTLVKTFSDTLRPENQLEGFIFRGIWHYVHYCDEPVISIYRNLEMLGSYNRTPPQAKKAFARPHAFPLVWSSPVEPYQYNPQLNNNEQMPRFFVQVRAIFEDGQFKVVEMLDKPTLDIPKYINPPKNKTETQPKK